MAYLVHITENGTIEELKLKKRITTFGSSQDTDIRCGSSHGAETFFQIIEKDQGYELAGVTPQSYILHEGKKKHDLTLSSFDHFSAGASKFIFTQQPLSTHKAVVQHISHYETFYTFTKTLSEATSVSDILQRLLLLLLDISHAQKGFLLSVQNHSKNDFDIVASVAMDRQQLKLSLNDLSHTLIQKARETQAPVIVDSLVNDPLVGRSESIFRLQVSSLACFPLVLQGKLIGFVYLGSDSLKSLFDAQTVKIIEIFLAQTALILKNFFLVEKLEKEKKALAERLTHSQIIGTSPEIDDLHKKIEKIAPLDLSILIVGETGTGKELVARNIHQASPRHDKPFVAINCGAIPQDLLESVLFGHKKGSFTGATSDKIGKFEAAHQGTLFLDEIGEMPLRLQVKLLRVLQEKVIERVGDIQEIPIDIRVLAATHQNIEKMIKAGTFREDLYYRLNEVYLSVPSLRDRHGDILFLTDYFLEKHRASFGATHKVLSPEARQKLVEHSWPGNIRQLENVIKRALVFSDSAVIKPEHIEIQNPSEPILSLKEARENFLGDYLRRAVVRAHGNKAKAADMLGISVRTLFRIENARASAISALQRGVSSRE